MYFEPIEIKLQHSIYVQMMLASQKFYIIIRQFHYLSGLALKYLLITLSFDILNDFSCLLESHQSNTIYSNVYIKANLIILALYIHVYYNSQISSHSCLV